MEQTVTRRVWAHGAANTFQWLFGKIYRVVDFIHMNIGRDPNKWQGVMIRWPAAGLQRHGNAHWICGRKYTDS
jgi:hypothetical protein